MEQIKFTLDAEDQMRVAIPITKVDTENRLVSGFATLDNVDKHGDVIEADASSKAFERFRGNIREMHMPVAVGKMISFETKEYYDEESDTKYNGVYVTAKVSKGAQDTWEKVLDGTLSGFSIGAYVKSKDDVYKEDGSHYRIIKDYELFELSLVDSPANPLANVISIKKADDGSTEVSGIAVQAAQEVKQDEEDQMVAKFMDRVVSFIEKRIGGNDMSDKVTEDAVEEVETEVDAETAEETVEKAADVSEVEVEETPEKPAFDEDKIVDSIVEKVLERLSESVETAETDEVVTEESVDEEAEDAVSKALSDITDTLKSLAASVESVKETQDEVSGRIESLEKSTAKKKSVDAQDEDEVVEKSFWGASFTGKNHISVDSV